MLANFDDSLSGLKVLLMRDKRTTICENEVRERFKKYFVDSSLLSRHLNIEYSNVL